MLTQKPVHNVYSRFIHNRQKLEITHCPSAKWINKLWCIHITEYYSTVKMNQLLIHNNNFDESEITVVSERNQMQKV